MNCQEVIELIQRCLDKDLSGPEYEMMLSHIKQCPTCSVMFERLERLSAELENLPKVAPAFSLVDAILPRLDYIDRLKAEGKLTDDAEAQPDSAVPATPRKKRRERLSWRIFGGVVAAGIVLGLFIINQPKQAVKNADELMMADAMKASSGADQAADAAKPDDQASAHSGSAENKTVVPLVGKAPQPPAAEEPKPPKSAAFGKQDAQERSSAAAPAATPDQRASDKNHPVQTLESPATDNASGAGSMPMAKAAPEAAASPSAQGNDQASEDGEHKLMFLPTAASPPAAASPSAAPAQKLASPNGDWTAEVYADAAGIRIVIKDKDGRAAYTSAAYRADELTNLVWSHEGKWLEYDLVTANAKNHAILDVEQKTKK